MRKCAQCSANKIEDNETKCPRCGATLESVPDPDSGVAGDDALDFVVTEKTEDDREFVGESGGLSVAPPSGNDSKSRSEDDERLEIERPGSEQESPLIGKSDSYLPLEPADLETQDDLKADADQEKERTGSPSDKLQALSEEEIKSIEANLYGGEPGGAEQKSNLSSMDPIKGRDLLRKESITPPASEHQAFSPADLSPSNDLPAPKMATRGRGVAFFYRNYIELLGSGDIHGGDELAIGTRVYELKAKKVGPFVKYGVLGAVFAAVLLAIGTLFVSDIGLGGSGHITGVVLGQSGYPMTKSVTIRFPELNKSVRTDSDGLFCSGGLPNGTHKIEFVWDGVVQGTDYATVVDGKATLISLQPQLEDLVVKETSVVTTEAQPTKAVPQVTTDNTAQVTKSKSPSASKKKTKRSSSTSKFARLTLEANVEGARLALSGKVVGAGNVTFDRLKSGQHSFEVSVDGYEPANGQITLKAGETAVLAVNLTPLTANEKVKSYSAEDFLYSGARALKEGRHDQAVSDLTEALNADPSLTRAYFARGEAYEAKKNKERAYDDFVRAAEIHYFNKAYSSSVAAYSKAIDVDKKGISAWLGRASASLAKGEDRAAVIDYESVIRMDKRNAQAYLGLGQARFRQGSYKKAIKSFKDARSLNTKDPVVHQYLMLSYLATDDTKNVRKSYKKFINVANQKQVEELHADQRFAAVVRIVEMDR